MKKARQTVPLPFEDETTEAVADALGWGAAPGWLWSHFPAGELRDAVTGAKLKRMGLQPGWPDFLLISPTGMHYWLELKRGRASLKKDQQVFALAMLERGVPWFLARSANEAIAKLNEWGALRLRVSA